MLWALLLAVSICCYCCCCCHATSEAEKSPAFEVHLRTGRVDVAALQARHLRNGGRQLAASNAGHLHHVHSLWGPLAVHSQYLLALDKEAWRSGPKQLTLIQELSFHGVVVAGFLPPHAWALSAPPSALPMLLKIADASVTPLQAEHKVAPEWDTMYALLDGTEHVPDELMGAVRVPDADLAERGTVFADMAESGTAVAASALSPLLNSIKVLKPTAASTKSTESTESTESTSGSNASDDSIPGSGLHRRLLQPDDLDRTGSTCPFPDGSKVLIQVLFPYLEADDLNRLGLIHPPLRGIFSSKGSGQGGDQQQQQQRQHVNGTFSPAMAAVEDWPDALGLLGLVPGCEAEVVLESHESVMVAACTQDIRRVIKWLSLQPSVRWLAPVLHTRLHNIYASAITEAGSLSSSSSVLSASSHPMWAAGLDGSGQVVGCGDSGVDMDSCYFFDAAVPFTGFQRDANGYSAFKSSTHRKLVMYMALQDQSDAFGHGTHVAGTILGSTYGTTGAQNPSAATGMAPAAKLSFLDLSSGNVNSVSTPAPLDVHYFPLNYAMGARIHSDSWGSDYTTYDSMAVSVDRFTWNNQDFLPIFAAGNYGSLSSYLSTITSPAVCKNGMAVGATLNYIQAGYSSSSSMKVYDSDVRVSIAGRQIAAYSIRVAQATFGGDAAALNGQELLVVVATPDTACSSLSSLVQPNSIIVAVRGGCSGFGTKLRNAQNAGAAAMLITNDRQEGYFLMSSNSPTDGDLSIPLLNVPMEAGRILWDAEALGQTVTIRFSPSPEAPETDSYEDVAPFSSFGPTSDGRIKPDIVAPGVLVSALSDGVLSGHVDGCAITLKQGTSMATPVVSGSAALVRQYFAKGFYPTGTATAANAYSTPSGMLTKAVLMGGATRMMGNVQINFKGAGPMIFPLEATPSYRQGFGRVDLTTSLPLGSINWRLQVVDWVPIKQGEAHEYCIDATGGGALRVTLAWHDYPGDPAAAQVLVNDLNLQVRGVGLENTVLLGNCARDSVNNVETIQLDSIAPGNVAISVLADRVFAKGGAQNYALVVMGQFEGNIVSPFNPVGGYQSAPSPGTCIEILVDIDATLSSPLLTSNQVATFYFNAGNVVAGGYECTLLYSSSGDTSGGPAADAVQPWSPCTSPFVSNPLPDDSYTFMVRAKGQKVANTRTVTVDHTPPTTTLAQSIFLAPSSQGQPTTITAIDSITFIFTAVDASPVAFRCSLVYKSTNGSPPFFRSDAPNLGINTTVPCSSPVTLYGLYFGDWTFTVQGVDKAGNAELAPPQGAWRVRYTNNQVYTRVTSGPPELTNSRVLPFSLTAFEGSGDAPPLPLSATNQFEYKMWLQAAAEPDSWTVTSRDLTVLAPSDGIHNFTARARNYRSDAADSLASRTVMVDTVPPHVVVTKVPQDIQTDPVVRMSFTTLPADDATFYCRWLSSPNNFPAESTAANSPATSFASCGTVPGSASNNVTEGYWLFQVRGQDAANNLSPPMNVTFRTDLYPPTVASIQYAAYTNEFVADVVFSLTDGDLGTGVANSSCAMRAVYLPTGGKVPPSSATNPRYELPNGVPISPCTGDTMTFQLQEGNYSFDIKAADNAGLKMEESFSILVDLSPPVTVINSPIQRATDYFSGSPSVLFAVRDFPDGAASGVASTECLLTQTSSFGAIPVPATGTSSWKACSNPATFSGLGGTYALQVRATDNSGNQGNATGIYYFTVDGAVIVAPGSSDSSSRDNTPMIIGIAAGGGFVVLVVVVLAILLCRRRAKKQPNTSRSVNYILPPPPPAAMSYPAHPSLHMVPTQHRGPYYAPPAYRAPASYGEGQAQAYGTPGHGVASQAPRTVVQSDSWANQWENDRMRQAIQASIEQENIRRATQLSASMPMHDDDVDLQAALRASLAISQPGGNGVAGSFGRKQ